MSLIDKIKEIFKQLKKEAAPKTADQEQPEKKKAGTAADHGFMEAVKDEISTPGEGASSHETTVEELYQDLNRRKQKGEMPRNPMEALMDVLGKRPASEVYASRAVFDLSHLYRDHFMKALRTSDSRKLSELFRATYTLFLDQPEVVGITHEMINRKNEDTDPVKWEVRCAAMPDGTPAALCCIPVQSKTVFARLTGIVFSDSGDEYYFCMMGKDEKTPSEVMRNNGTMPVKTGEIRGTDPEIMDRFLECIRGQREG